MGNQTDAVKSNKSTVFLTLMTLLSGLITAILFQTGILLIPFTSGFLASVFLIECTKKRRMTYILPVILVVFDLVFNGIFSVNCLASILCAIIICLCFVKWRSKSECAVYLTIAVTAFTVISFILAGFFITKEFSIAALREFYLEQLDLIRAEFIKAFSNIAMENSEGELVYAFTEADLNYLFDNTFKSIAAFFAIIGFAISGIALKIFTRFGVRKSPFTERLATYRFRTTNTFVYFYILLVIFSMLMGMPSTTLEISLNNLYTVFMFVYAYLGYKYLSEMFARKNGKPWLSRILVLCLALFFSSFAVQLLSFLGAFLTVSRNRKDAISNSNDTEN